MTLCVVLLAHCMHAGDDILCGAARSLYACWRLHSVWCCSLIVCMLEMTFGVVLLAHCMHAGDDILCGAARSLYACWR